MELPDSPDAVPVAVPRNQRLLLALRLLREAFDDAAGLRCDVWQFAVTLGELRDAGAGSTDLRWLVAHGLAEQAVELSVPDAAKRTFRRVCNFGLYDASAFVLTEAGGRWTADVESTLGRSEPDDALRLLRHPNERPAGALPCWDSDLRELRRLGLVVKRFAVPAPSQEAILTAFEEDGWPVRIDDPLPRHPAKDPCQRLHDAIRGLNRNQSHKLLRFHRDGTGEGIRWVPLTSG